MTDDNVVPDPKSGRDGSPQNNNAAKHYMRECDRRARMNEIAKLRSELIKIRLAMSEAQTVAGLHRRKYDFVAENVKDALRATRQAHRELSKTIYSLTAYEDGEEE